VAGRTVAQVTRLRPGQLPRSFFVAIGAQKQPEQPTDNRDDNGTPKGWPEASDLEAKAEQAGDPTDKHEQQGIHDESKNAERQNEQREGEEFEHAADGRVNKPEDDGDKDERENVLERFLALGHDGQARHHDGGEPQGDGVDDGGEQESTHAVILTASVPQRERTG